MNNQRRRFEFVGEQMRRKFPIQLAIIPGRTFKFPFNEPKLFGGAIGRLSIEGAIENVVLPR